MKTTTTYIIAKVEDKDLKEWMYNNNWHTFMKWNVMMEWYKTNPYPWYHIPTIEEMKDAFKWKTVEELQKEIWFKFSGYRGTDWDFGNAGDEETFWSCSPASGKGSAHYCYLWLGCVSPFFANDSRECGFGVLFVKDKISDFSSIWLFQEVIQKLQDKKALNEQENKRIQEAILLLSNLTT